MSPTWNFSLSYHSKAALHDTASSLTSPTNSSLLRANSLRHRDSISLNSRSAHSDALIGQATCIVQDLSATSCSFARAMLRFPVDWLSVARRRRGEHFVLRRQHVGVVGLSVPGRRFLSEGSRCLSSRSLCIGSLAGRYEMRGVGDYRGIGRGVFERRSGGIRRGRGGRWMTQRELLEPLMVLLHFGVGRIEVAVSWVHPALGVVAVHPLLCALPRPPRRAIFGPFVLRVIERLPLPCVCEQHFLPVCAVSAPPSYRLAFASCSRSHAPISTTSQSYQSS